MYVSGKDYKFILHEGNTETVIDGDPALDIREWLIEYTRWESPLTVTSHTDGYRIIKWKDGSNE